MLIISFYCLVSTTLPLQLTKKKNGGKQLQNNSLAVPAPKKQQYRINGILDDKNVERFPKTLFHQNRAISQHSRHLQHSRFFTEQPTSRQADVYRFILMETVFSEPVVNLPYGGEADAPLDVSSQICIGEYEILGNGEVRLGPHGKRWLLEEKAKEGKRKVSLSKESEDTAHYPPKSALGFPSLLHWILNTSSSRHSLESEGINFVCYASVLERIASTPFNPEQDWQFLITKLYKVIFIGAGPDEAEQDAERSKLDQMFLHYLSTSVSQERRPQRAIERPSEGPAFENGLHCNVFIKSFNNFRVLYAMNAGCIGKDGRFVQCITTEKDVSNAEEWWLPAYLCGGHTTIVGNMDGKDLVKEIHAYNIGNTDPETENVAQHFLFNALNVLTKATATTNEWAPFLFEYNAKKQQFSLHTIPELLPQSFTSQFELFHFSELKTKD